MGSGYRQLPARPARAVSESRRCSSSNAPRSASAREVTLAPGVEVLPATRTPSTQRKSAPGGDGARPYGVPVTTPGRHQRGDRRALAGVRSAGAVETDVRLDYPPYRSSLLRHPTKSRVQVDPEGVELVAPGLRRARRRAARGRPDDPARRRADRRADAAWPGGSWTATAARYAASSSRSGRRTRRAATSTSATSTRRPLDPNFTGVGRCLTDDDGGYEFTTDQAGPVPVAQPPQRLATRAHPLLAVRHRLHPAAGHPDVLPGRPAVRARPDLPVDRRPAGPRAAGGDVRPRPHRAGVVHRLSLGHRAHRLGGHARRGGGE